MVVKENYHYRVSIWSGNGTFQTLGGEATPEQITRSSRPYEKLLGLGSS